MVAKSSKPHSEGKFVKDCLIEMSDILAPGMKKVIGELTPSRQTVTRRIQEMANDVNKSLANIIQNAEAFSLCIDDSTDINDVAQCAIFIRLV